jgi:hypothetical protein
MHVHVRVISAIRGTTGAYSQQSVRILMQCSEWSAKIHVKVKFAITGNAACGCVSVQI